MLDWFADVLLESFACGGDAGFADVTCVVAAVESVSGERGCAGAAHWVEDEFTFVGVGFDESASEFDREGKVVDERRWLGGGYMPQVKTVVGPVVGADLIGGGEVEISPL